MDKRPSWVLIRDSWDPVVEAALVGSIPNYSKKKHLQQTTRKKKQIEFFKDKLGYFRAKIQNRPERLIIRSYR